MSILKNIALTAFLTGILLTSGCSKTKLPISPSTYEVQKQRQAEQKQRDEQQRIERAKIVHKSARRNLSINYVTTKPMNHK
jgi:hypothetical protein